jgi:hypothetical protein
LEKYTLNRFKKYQEDLMRRLKMTEIKLNDRFDRLTNLDIATYYNTKEAYFMKSSIRAAFAYWVVAQSPYEEPDITDAIKGFNRYLSNIFKNPDIPEKFSFTQLAILITEDILASIPEVEILNHPRISSGVEYENRFNSSRNPDFDFIDLGALARNIFYMLWREHITQD